MTELEPLVQPSPAEVVRLLLSDETWAVSAYERILSRDDAEDFSHKLRYCLSSHEQRRQALLEELGRSVSRHAADSDPAPSYQPLDAQADLDLQSVLEALAECEAAALERCRAATSAASGRLHELLSMRILPAEVQTADISASLVSTYRGAQDSTA